MDKCPKCQTRLSWIAGEPAHPDNQYCDNCGWPHELAGEEAEKALENALPDTIQVSRAEYEELRRDAERWRIVRDAWLDDEDAKMAEEYADAEIEHRAAINMPANGEGVRDDATR
jgi:hypothetical protein